MKAFFGTIIVFITFVFALTKMLHLQGAEIGLLALSLGVLFWFLRGFSNEVYNNRVYHKNPLKSGSYPNFLNQTAGLRWTPKNQILSDKNKDESVYIDKFTHSYDVLKEFNLLHRLIFSKTKEVYKKPLIFTRGSLVIGSMGSGKTEFINSILAQKFYARAIIHDIKGDYVEHSYSRRDIILNPFDKRGKIWDIFKEAERYPKIIDSFFQSLLSGILGSSEQNRNFFTISSKDRFVKIFMEVHTNQELTTKEKWQYFIDKTYIYFKEVNEAKQKSEKDVVSTMKLLIEYLEYINYLIQNDTKTFTIQKFLKSNKKLFLLNNPVYSDFLTPYFSAFLDSFTKIFMSQMKETKDDLTLFLLDEYISLLPLLSEESKSILHTLIRSKGGCLFPAIQYLPEDKKLKQQILNSSENIYIFQTSDTATTKEIKEILGEVVYSIENRSEAYNRDRGYQNSYTTGRELLLTDEILKELGETYSHISFTQSNQQLYKGYTKLLKREKQSKPCVEGDFNQFIQSKYQQ